MWKRTINFFGRYHYKRYFIVLLLLIVAFLFGKNLDVVPKEQQILQDQAYTEQKVISGVFDILSSDNQLQLKSLFSVKKGQCGRLFFDLKNLPSDNNSALVYSENPKVKLSLINDYEESQDLGVFETTNSGSARAKEVDLCANSDYQNLLFQKEGDIQDNSYEISNVSFYPLSNGKVDFNNLSSPIVGDTNFDNIVFQSSFDSINASQATSFTRKNQEIGQIFTADTDVISGAELKLMFTGVGGIGNYSLELKEADVENGQVQLSDNSIASYQFDKDVAAKELSMGDGIYHIPLPAHLEKGKTYFIGVNNGGVSFNLLNTLKVYSGIGTETDGEMVSTIGGKSKIIPGRLYLRVYGAEYQKTADDKILTGSKILNNGNGLGLYNYQEKGESSDFLDIFESSDTQNNQSHVYYDNINRSILAPDKNNAFFTYKFNTVRPFNKFSISMEQPGGLFTDSKVSYSFDNKNWQDIKMEKNEQNSLVKTNGFKDVINGNGKGTVVYIRISYDELGSKGSNGLFGIKNISVKAELYY